VDPAVYLAVICPEEERAVREFFPSRIDPVIYSGDPGEIGSSEVFAGRASAIPEGYRNVLKDIRTMTVDPWDEILRYPFLVPPPFLAALPALQTVLFFRH